MQTNLLFRLFVAIFACTQLIANVRADDGEVEKQLADKGAKFGSSKGVVTSCQISDCSKWTEPDFKNLAQLSHLTSIDVGGGLNDENLPWLAALHDLQSIQTNKATVSDSGVKGFTVFTKLRVLKFFHPGKAFTGKGLAELASMPSLQSLTVAGSDAFGDEGMAAVAKLQQLKEFRTWHAGQSPAGVEKLREMKGLKSLNLGQRLSYKPPACVSDQAIASIVELKSLESLTLSESRLTLAALGQLKELPKLKSLTLDGIDISESDIEKLKAELASVQVKWTKPTDIYMKRIAAMFGKP